MAGTTAASLERYMDLLAARQRVAASNIANVDTPGYRARDIDFRYEMQNLTAAPGEPFLAMTVREDRGGAVKNDGNSVSLDREMQKLSENVIRFTVASLLLRRQIQGIRDAIREGR